MDRPSNGIMDNEEAIFELAEVVDENAQALFEIAEMIGELDERLNALEGKEEEE